MSRISIDCFIDICKLSFISASVPFYIIIIKTFSNRGTAFFKSFRAAFFTIYVISSSVKDLAWHICSPFVFLVEGQYHTRWSFLV